MNAIIRQIISSAVLSAAEKRNRMVAVCMPWLRHYAYSAMRAHRLSNSEFVVLCIKVDSRWYDIANKLMPDADWQQIRDAGSAPIAMGWKPVSFCGLLAERLPDLDWLLAGKTRDGYAKCIALDESGCTVYEIKPARHHK